MTPIRKEKFQSNLSSISSTTENFINNDKPESQYSHNDLRDLPHKKRISSIKEIDTSPTKASNLVSQIFSCQLCGNETYSQLNFFAHLKSHYEPSPVLPQPSQATQGEYEENLSFNEEIHTHDYNHQNPDVAENTEVIVTKFEVIEVKEEKVPSNEIHGLEREDIELQQEICNSDDADEEIWLEEELTKLSNEGADHLFAQTNANIEEENAAENVMKLEINEPHEVVEQPLIPNHITDHVNNDPVTEPDTIIKLKRKKRSPKKNKLDIDTDPGATLFPCIDCEKVFKSKHALYYHKRTHTGIRSHVCETCGKGFFNSSALKVHSRLHSGELLIQQ